MPSLRSMVVLLLLALMEILAGFALVVGTGVIAAVHLGGAFLWLLLLAGAGGLIAGLGIALVGPAEPWNRILLLAAGGLFAWLPAVLTGSGVPGTAFAGLLLTVAYWRGLRLSLEPADLDTVKRAFGTGFGVVFLGFLWGITRDVNHSEPFWSLLAVTGIAYTLTAMVTLVVARLERQREPGSGLAVFVAVAVQLGLLLAIALGAVVIFGHDLAGALGNATQPLRNVVGGVGYHVALVLAAPIQWLLDQFHGHLTLPHIRNPSAAGPARGQARGKKPHIGHVNQTPLTILGLIALAALVIIIAAIVWRLLPRIPRYRPARGYKEERRSLFSASEAARAFILWLLSLFRRGAAGVAQIVARTRRRVWAEYPDDAVRRLYAQLLRRTEATGIPRPADATPDEFGRRLASRWPDVAFELGALTEAYVLRRYGDIAPDGERIARLNEHWHRIRSALRVRRTTPATRASAIPAPSQGEEDGAGITG